jgi:hypothetical protein
MKKTPALTIMTRQLLMDDLVNSINERNGIINILKLNDLDAQIELYYFNLLLVDQKINMIQEILINNKF